MGISRRDLFKLTGMSLAGAALSGAGEVLGTDHPGREQAALPRRVSLLSLRPVTSCCGGCPAGCGAIGWIDDQGQLLRITGNPADPDHQGHLCPRGIAAPNLVEDPDRLLVPLRRVGPRGSGRFAPASWSEALTALGGRITRLAREKQGDRLVLLGPHDPVAGLAAERLAAAAGSPNSWHPRSTEPANLAAAARLFWGVAGVQPDLERAKLALLFGANPHETYPFWMRPPAAHWVVFDPRCSSTAGAPGCSWRPIPPGTDGLVALALARLLLAEGKHDASFLARWTDVGEEELRRHLGPYTAERVQQETGLPAEELAALALRFAAEPASTVVVGEGAVAHRGGVETARAIMLLATVAGRVETPGGLLVPQLIPLAPPRSAPAAVKRQERSLFGDRAVVPAEPLAQLAAGQVELDTLIVWGGDPVWSEAQGSLAARMLADERRVGLLAVAAGTLNETARLADWVLPLAPWPESWGLAAPPARRGAPVLLLRRPLVPPRGEARGALDFLLALARAADPALAAFFRAPDAAAFCEATLVRAERLRAVGGLEYLLRHGLWVDRAAARAPGFHESFLPATSSEKLSLRSAGSAPGSRPSLPGWPGVAPAAAVAAAAAATGGDGSGAAGGTTAQVAAAASPLAGQDELLLVVHRSPMLYAAEDASAKWLSELHPGSRVLLATSTASRLGIADGDRVLVRSAAGVIEGTAFLGEGLHPRVVALARGGGHRAGSRVALGHPFASADPDTRRIRWGPEGVGANPAEIVIASADPLGGGQAWNGTPVTVERATGRGARR